MSLNEIRLTPALVAALYQNVLIEKRPEAKPALLYHGGNQKEILIVVQDKNEPFLAKPQWDFLMNVLNACKLNEQDIALINWQQASGDYKEVLTALKSRIIILFGITPLQFGLPLHFPPFQVQAFDSRQYLSAPSLDKIEASKGIKAELWQSLKKLFLIG